MWQMIDTDKGSVQLFSLLPNKGFDVVTRSTITWQMSNYDNQEDSVQLLCLVQIKSFYLEYGQRSHEKCVIMTRVLFN